MKLAVISDDFEVSPERVSTPIKIRPQSCVNFLFWVAGIRKRHAGNLCVIMFGETLDQCIGWALDFFLRGPCNGGG